MSCFSFNWAQSQPLNTKLLEKKNNYDTTSIIPCEILLYEEKNNFPASPMLRISKSHSAMERDMYNYFLDYLTACILPPHIMSKRMLYYVQEDEIAGVLTIQVCSGMSARPGWGVEGLLINDFNRSMILENDGRFQGSLVQQSSIMAATWGFKSRGISSLLPLKPTAATTCNTAYIGLCSLELSSRRLSLPDNYVNLKIVKTRISNPIM